MKQISSIKDANNEPLQNGDFVYTIYNTSTSGSKLIPGMVIGFRKIGEYECAKLVVYNSNRYIITHRASHKIIKCNDMRMDYGSEIEKYKPKQAQ